MWPYLLSWLPNHEMKNLFSLHSHLEYTFHSVAFVHLLLPQFKHFLLLLLLLIFISSLSIITWTEVQDIPDEGIWMYNHWVIYSHNYIIPLSFFLFFFYYFRFFLPLTQLSEERLNFLFQQKYLNLFPLPFTLFFFDTDTHSMIQCTCW